ncbi:MAG: flagellar export chaperone FlgN [Granulosicoccus sp.]
MNHSTKKKLKPPPDSPSQQSLISKAEHLIGEFERLLASELHLLKTGQSVGLEEIAEAKQALVDQIGGHEAELIGLFEQQRDNVEVDELKKRLTQCRTDNKSNHALVMLELKHANKSLELLRSVLNMDDLSLYSERGEVQINREKRKFGSA